MQNYEYLRLITSSLHVLNIILSFMVMWIYCKKIIIEKAPYTVQENFLLVSNLPHIATITFCFLFAIANVAYITNFFNRIPKYAYIIPFLIVCLVFLILLINANRKQS